MDKIKDFVFGAIGIILGFAFIVLGWGAFAWVVSNFVSVERAGEPQVSQEAMDNTERRAYESAMRSEFVTGCVGEGVSLEDCQCVLASLEDMYDDFLTNEARINRILRDGYNEKEVDTMLECVGIYNYNSI